jgi:hypothetical protein
MCSALDGATVWSEKSTNTQSVESTQRTLATLERHWQAAAAPGRVVELLGAAMRVCVARTCITSVSSTQLAAATLW